MKSLLFILAALIACGPAQAGDGHDRARRAVEEGRSLPLKDILERAKTVCDCQLIEAELEEGHGGILIYEIRMLAEDGRMMKLIYDAGSGELLKVKGREGRR